MSGLVRNDSATFKSAARSNAPLASPSERDALQKKIILSSAAHSLSRDGVSKRAQKRAIVMLAATELTQLRDGNPYPSRPTVAKLDAAQDRLQRATNDLAESNDSFIRAKKMLYEVAGIDMLRDERPTDAATEKYPSLVTARGKFNRAWDQFIIFGPRDSKYSAQVETAGKEWRDAWAAARDHEAIGTKLRDACDAGFAYADFELEDLIKEVKPR